MARGGYVLRVEGNIRPERQPKGAVGREGRRAEDVALAELPHSGEYLRNPAIGQCDAEHDRLSLGVHDPGVHQAEQEGGERERAKAERRRVRDHPHLLRRQLAGDGDLPGGGVVDVRNDPGDSVAIVPRMFLKISLKQTHYWSSSFIALPDMRGWRPAQPWIRLLCPAHSLSRSANFCSFPVDVRGSDSTNSIAFGTLKRAMWLCR